jgi:hypothetical protein
VNRRVLIPVLFLALLGGTVWFVAIPRDPPEPMYQGKPLTFWLPGLYSTNRAEQQAALDASAHAGTNAIPFLLSLMRAHDSPAKTAVLRWFRHHPRIQNLFGKTRFVSAGEEHSLAYNGLWPLCRDARSAVPELVQIYETRPDAWRKSMIPVIFYCVGPDAAAAVPALLHVATNSASAADRANAILPLGAIHARPEIVVPVLMNCLHDPSGGIRANPACDLGDFGTNALPALPALTNLLNDSDQLVRMMATNALTKLHALDSPK